MKKRSRKRKHTGLSLIELLVAFAILAILAKIAMPAFQNIDQIAKDATVKAALGEMRAAIMAYSGAEIAAGRASRFATGTAGGWPSFAQMDDIKYTSSGTLPKVMSRGDVPENPYAKEFISEPDRVMPDSNCLSVAWLWEEGAAYAACFPGDPECSPLETDGGGSSGGSGGGPPPTLGGWCYNENTGQIWTSTNVNGEASL